MIYIGDLVHNSNTEMIYNVVNYHCSILIRYDKEFRIYKPTYLLKYWSKIC